VKKNKFQLIKKNPDKSGFFVISKLKFNFI